MGWTWPLELVAGVGGVLVLCWLGSGGPSAWLRRLRGSR
jgi:hypothetical protein